MAPTSFSVASRSACTTSGGSETPASFRSGVGMGSGKDPPMVLGQHRSYSSAQSSPHQVASVVSQGGYRLDTAPTSSSTSVYSIAPAPSGGSAPSGRTTFENS